MIAQTITCGSSQRFLILAGKKQTNKNVCFLSEIRHNDRNQTVGVFFTATASMCAGVAATGGTRPAHHFRHVKETLLLPDSGRPVFPCCLLSQPPVSGLGSLHTRP